MTYEQLQALLTFVVGAFFGGLIVYGAALEIGFVIATITTVLFILGFSTGTYFGHHERPTLWQVISYDPKAFLALGQMARRRLFRS